HSDIVPPGDLSLWQSDPYQVRVEGEKIYGRGVEDNQHGIVSSILAVRAIIDSGLKPLRPIGIAIVADEETGSRYGLCYLLEKRRELFRDTDLIVVPDGGNETGTMIEVAEKSILWVRFTVLGKQCHASTPHKGKNSLTAAARLIVALEKIRENFDERDELFSPPISTFEPTKMEANVENVNTIPGKDVFYMDCRILPRFEVETVLERCREIAGEVGESLSVEIKVDIAHKEDAAPPTAADAPVVKSLSRAIRLVTGREARPMGIGGGTVAAFFRKAGLPAAVWCTSPDTAHQPNEYCLIPDILTDAKVFAAMAMEA
ncbi:MAG: diaminopimelate aminotransferase, partial [Deltaproteobacteria bacterium]